MKTITVTSKQKQYTILVDEEDFDKVNKYKWNIQVKPRSCYAIAPYEYIKEKQRYTTIKLHSLILPNCDRIDHIDGNGLNNQKYNLRAATNQQNLFNSQKPIRKIPCTSQYKGVCWHRRDHYWQAQIILNGKVHFLGRFAYQTEAAEAYNKKAKELFGDFAKLNVLPLDYVI